MLPVNVDLLLPSLPCGELVTEVTDESGTQQLAVTDTLQKLRVDRNGVPIDIPRPVDWTHAVAPGFQQRKFVQLMEDVHVHLRETLYHLQHEDEENPNLSHDEHQEHRMQLAEQERAAPARMHANELTSRCIQAHARWSLCTLSPA